MDTSTTLEDAQRILDEELLVQERRIMELRRRRNSYARACRLPPKLLLEIFLLHRVPFEMKKWHGITHVCRYWRHVALDAPTLWTAPPPHHRDYTLLMLERSQPADINIRMDGLTFYPTTTFIFKQATRIKTLGLFQDAQALARTQQGLLACGQELSRLEGFSIENNRISDDRFTLSANPLGHLTSLRRLELYGIGVDWDMFPFPNLTHLRLHTRDSSPEINTQEFCHLLAGMTFLKDISLNMADISVRDGQAISTATVLLPHLNALLLRNGCTSKIRALLNGLTLPNLQRLEVGADRWSEEGNPTIEITAAAISTTLKNGDFGILDALMISTWKPELYSRHIGFERCPLQVSVPGDTIGVTAQCLTGLTSATQDNYIHLTHVHIVVPLCRDGLMRILGALPQMEELKIYGKETIEALSGALKETIDYVLGPSIASPRLHSITCRWFKWEEEDFSVLTDFCNALAQRHQGGYGVKRVCLLDCAFPESTTATLDAIGVRVYFSEGWMDSTWLGDAST